MTQHVGPRDQTTHAVGDDKHLRGSGRRADFLNTFFQLGSERIERGKWRLEVDGKHRANSGSVKPFAKSPPHAAARTIAMHQ